jgi:hypothetical protein
LIIVVSLIHIKLPRYLQYKFKLKILIYNLIKINVNIFIIISNYNIFLLKYKNSKIYPIILLEVTALNLLIKRQFGLSNLSFKKIIKNQFHHQLLYKSKYKKNNSTLIKLKLSKNA